VHLHSQYSASKYLPKTSKMMLNFQCEFWAILPENDLGYLHVHVDLSRRVFVFSRCAKRDRPPVYIQHDVALRP